MDPNVSRVEVELSLVWASENPDLFLDAVAKFRDTHQGWGVKIDTFRAGFITLAASRFPVEEPESEDRKKLKRIAWLLGAIIQDADTGMEPDEIIREAHKLCL